MTASVSKEIYNYKSTRRKDPTLSHQYTHLRLTYDETVVISLMYSFLLLTLYRQEK